MANPLYGQFIFVGHAAAPILAGIGLVSVGVLVYKIIPPARRIIVYISDKMGKYIFTDRPYFWSIVLLLTACAWFLANSSVDRAIEPHKPSFFNNLTHIHYFQVNVRCARG